MENRWIIDGKMPSQPSAEPKKKQKSVIVGLARDQVAISSQEIAGELSAAKEGRGKPWIDAKNGRKSMGKWKNPWENP